MMTNEMRDTIHRIPNQDHMGLKIVLLALCEEIDFLKKRVETLERHVNTPPRMG